MTTSMQTIQKGYKQTEIGVIPADWDVQYLGALCGKITTGKLNANAMVEGGEYRFYTCAEEYYQINKYAFDTEALLISGNGANVGYIHYYKGKFNAYQRTYVLSDFLADVQYLKLFLDRNLKERIRVEVNSGNTPYITMGTLTEMQLAIPQSKPEQSAIATALSDTDSLIAKLEKLIEKKKNIKQGAMQELLTGKRRLHGFSGKWETKKLRDIAEMNSGGTPSTSVPEYYGGNIPWVSITDMTNVRKYLFTTERSLTDKGFANSATKMFPKGTVLYAMYASIGECCIATTAVCTSQAILGIRPKKGLDNHYLYFHLTYKKEEVKTMGQQGTQSNLNAGMVKDFEILLPEINEQTAISTVLSDMDTEIEKLESQLTKYQNLKQGMMQVLLTGKIRLLSK